MRAASPVLLALLLVGTATADVTTTTPGTDTGGFGADPSTTPTITGGAESGGGTFYSPPPQDTAPETMQTPTLIADDGDTRLAPLQVTDPTVRPDLGGDHRNPDVLAGSETGGIWKTLYERRASVFAVIGGVIALLAATLVAMVIISRRGQAEHGRRLKEAGPAVFFDDGAVAPRTRELDADAAKLGELEEAARQREQDPENVRRSESGMRY